MRRNKNVHLARLVLALASVTIIPFGLSACAHPGAALPGDGSGIGVPVGDPGTPGGAPSAPQGPGNDYLIGTNYFSGWWHDPNPHFTVPGGDLRTEYPEREPKYGWYDDSQAVVDQEIKDAATDGIDFFSFDWYPDRPGRGPGVGVGLNDGLAFYQSSPNRGLMKFTIDYINHHPFGLRDLRPDGMSYPDWDQLRAQKWDQLTDTWIALFHNENYLKIDGKPVIEIFRAQDLQLDFSDDQHPDLNAHELARIPEERAILQGAIQAFRDKVAAAGFPGVLIGAGLDQPGLSGQYVQAHDDGIFDFFTAYDRVPVGRVTQHDNNYYNLIRDHHDYVWDYYAKYKRPTTDYVPIITQGWDKVNRPQVPDWKIDRTPQSFGDFLREARSYLDAHPQTNLSSDGPMKIAMIASWNEILEGHYILPTKAEGDAYLRQVGNVFGFDHPELQVPRQYADLQQAVADYRAYADGLGLDHQTAGEVDDAFATIDDRLSDLDDALSDADSHPALVMSIAKHLRKDVEAVKDVLTQAGVDVATVTAHHDTVLAKRDSLLRVALGIGMHVDADDYAPTADQSVGLHLEASIRGSKDGKVEWSVTSPQGWGNPGGAVSGHTHDGRFDGTMTVTAPENPVGGTVYNLGGLLPGKGDLTGNLQQLSMQARVKYYCEWMTTDIPIALTIQPDVDKRVSAVQSPGSTQATVTLQNLKTSSLTGTLRIDAPGSVTSSLEQGSATVNLAAGAQTTAIYDLASQAATPQQVTIYFDEDGGGSVQLGQVVVTPPAPETYTIPTAPDGDATLRVKDGNVVIVTGNTSNLEAGPADGTEYRTVLTFDLSSLAGTSVQKVLLDLTEYHSVKPVFDTLLEHIDSANPIQAASYDTPALESSDVIPGAGAGAAGAIPRVFDVTDWVAEDLAAGKDYSTFRLRMKDAVPSTTAAVRQFRPVEYTPADATDAPRLEVTATAP